ncbi:hypothetical protein PE36_08776 [Moritella sp. PE36]|nr:hypothetical protein PE36_08776 [Moritella sp. PE36]
MKQVVTLCLVARIWTILSLDQKNAHDEAKCTEPYKSATIDKRFHRGKFNEL